MSVQVRETLFQDRFPMGFNKPTDNMEDKEKLRESITTAFQCALRKLRLPDKDYPRTV